MPLEEKSDNLLTLREKLLMGLARTRSESAQKKSRLLICK